MSHSILLANDNATRWGKLTIINYALGGEVVPLSDVPAAAGIDMFLLGTVPSGQNSLGVPLFPVLNSSTGAIQLFRDTAGTLSEVPTTATLNAVVTVCFHISAFNG